jgi:hypothetical protein
VKNNFFLIILIVKQVFHFTLLGKMIQVSKILSIFSKAKTVPRGNPFKEILNEKKNLNSLKIVDGA